MFTQCYVPIVHHLANTRTRQTSSQVNFWVTVTVPVIVTVGLQTLYRVLVNNTQGWLFSSRPYVVDLTDTRIPYGSGPGLTAALPASPGLQMWPFCDHFRLQVEPLFLGKISNLFSSDPQMEVSWQFCKPQSSINLVCCKPQFLKTLFCCE